MSRAMSNTRDILRFVARAKGWQVRVDNGQYPGDTYLLPGDPAKYIKVSWAAGGGVLTASSAGGFIHRFVDG